MPTVDLQAADLTNVGRSLVDVSANLVSAAAVLPATASTFERALTRVAAIGGGAAVIYSVTNLFRAPTVVVFSGAGGGGAGPSPADPAVQSMLAATGVYYRQRGFAGLFFTLWISTSIGLIAFGLYRERAIREEIRIRREELDKAEEEQRRAAQEEIEQLRRGRQSLANRMGQAELLRSDVALERLMPEETSRRVFRLAPDTIAASPPLLKFNGSAEAGQNTSTITLTPAASSKAGSAYLAAPINLRKGFVCEFSFRMLRDRGDGIAFLVQGQSDAAIGLHGYGLGYSGIERCLALEFDSYRNPDTADPADYHVSLHLPRPGKPKTTSHHEHSVVWAGPGRGVPKFNDGRTHDVRILWEPEPPAAGSDAPAAAAGNFRLLWKTADHYVPVLSHRIADLPGIVGRLGNTGTAWVGFSGGTGGSFQKQEITSWTLWEHDVVPVQEAPPVVAKVEAPAPGGASSGTAQAVVQEVLREVLKS